MYIEVGRIDPIRLPWLGVCNIRISASSSATVLPAPVGAEITRLRSVRSRSGSTLDCIALKVGYLNTDRNLSGMTSIDVPPGCAVGAIVDRTFVSWLVG